MLTMSAEKVVSTSSQAEALFQKTIALVVKYFMNL
jgi:hypothetical protein